MATEARLAHLESALAQLTEAQAELQRAMARLTTTVDAMRGDLLELRYRQHAIAYFAPLLRRLREVPISDVDQLADDAERARRLTEAEHLDLVHADLVLSGTTRESQVPMHLVVEISALIDSRDVERAERRARLLREKVIPVGAQAAVAGEGITRDAEEMARSRGVHIVLDGTVMR